MAAISSTQYQYLHPTSNTSSTTTSTTVTAPAKVARAAFAASSSSTNSASTERRLTVVAHSTKDFRVTADPRGTLVLHTPIYSWKAEIVPSTAVTVFSHHDRNDYLNIRKLRLNTLQEDDLIYLFQETSVIQYATPKQIAEIQFSKYPKMPDNVFRIMTSEHLQAIDVRFVTNSQLCAMLTNNNPLTETQWKTVDIIRFPGIRMNFIHCLTSPHFKMADKNFHALMEIVTPTLSDIEIASIDLKVFAGTSPAMEKSLSRLLGILGSKNKLKFLNPLTVSKNYPKIPGKFFKYMSSEHLKAIDFSKMPVRCFYQFTSQELALTKNFSKEMYEERYRNVIDFEAADLPSPEEQPETLVMFIDQEATGSVPGASAVDPKSIGPNSPTLLTSHRYEKCLSDLQNIIFGNDEVIPPTQGTLENVSSNPKYEAYRQLIIKAQAYDARAFIYDQTGRILKMKDLMFLHPDKNIDRPVEAGAFWQCVLAAFECHMQNIR